MAGADDSLAYIFARNEFYRKNYHVMVGTVGWLLLIIVLLLGFRFLQITTVALPKYFPATPDGKIIQSPSEDINHLKLEYYNFNERGELIEWPEIQKKDLDLTIPDSNEHAILLFWVQKAVLAMFDLDYVNYRNRIQNLREFFTAQGYDKFLTAFLASKNLDAVKTGRRVAYATITDKAKVVSTGMLQGHKAWQVEMPLTVTYENPVKPPLQQKLYAVVKIARVSTLQKQFYGLAIYQINFKAA